MMLEKARHIVKNIMKHQKYKYDYIDDSSDLPIISILDTLQYTYCNIKYINELQVSISFAPNSLDVIIFPHPILIDKENVDFTILFINYINRFIKLGRFYVDVDSLDVAWRSNNVSYEILEAFPKKIVEENIINGITFWLDIAFPLSKLIKSEFDIKEACKYIDRLWGNEYE